MGPTDTESNDEDSDGEKSNLARDVELLSNPRDLGGDDRGAEGNYMGSLFSAPQ